MNMLNPTAIAHPDDFRRDDLNGLSGGRVQDRSAGSFLDRNVSKHGVPASAEDEVVYSP
jgi:hypothetical protein